MPLLKDSRFSVRMAYVMRTENQSNGRAHGCDHAQFFCAHGLIHAHRVIGVRMAMCTSKPIIGKDAARLGLSFIPDQDSFTGQECLKQGSKFPSGHRVVKMVLNT